MAAPLIAGLAARALAKKVATSAAKKATQKTVKKVIQKSKTNQIAKNSVKPKPANKSNPTNEKLNLSENVRLKRMKSGDLAKGQARLEEKRNQISNQFFGKSPTVKINSTIKAKSTDARALKAANKPIKEKPVKKMNRQELNDSIKKQLSNRREQDKRNYPSN